MYMYLFNKSWTLQEKCTLSSAAIPSAIKCIGDVSITDIHQQSTSVHTPNKLKLCLSSNGDKACRQLMVLYVRESQIQFQTDKRVDHTIVDDFSKARRERDNFQADLKRRVMCGRLSMCKMKQMHVSAPTVHAENVPTEEGIHVQLYIF